MKNEIKILISIIFLVIMGFIINSRRIKQETIDLIVLMELNDVFEKCHSRLDSNVENEIKINYKDSLYNYYISTYGMKICLCSGDSIRRVIENNVRNNVQEDWKFIY
ncbi:MAG: hypothetical protein Q8K02_08985 [Flavobacterium sp.]|nr:hypothetical protein [Flavobacterium sp.]